MKATINSRKHRIAPMVALAGLTSLLAVSAPIAPLISTGNPAHRRSSSRALRSGPANIAEHELSAKTRLSRNGLAEADETRVAKARESYGKLPLSFERNEGQIDPQVAFVSRGRGYSLFLTPTEAVLSLRKQQPVSTSGRSLNPEMTLLRMKLVGADAAARPVGIDVLPGKTNYFIGNDSRKWRTDVSTFSKVKYQGVYPGVDMVYYGNQQQLEYDLIVAPGTDPRAIKICFEGAQKLRLDGAGDLVLETEVGEVRQQKPAVYQEVEGGRRDIDARYVLRANHELSFELGEYDARKPLIIDPLVSYSTYLGGNGNDFINDIAVDSLGNIYMTGFTSSFDFPVTAGALQTAALGDDVFITKLNATGDALIYSTYLGGGFSESGFSESGKGIAVDSAGSVYVTGDTSSPEFPTTAGAFRTAQRGGSDAFVTKLNAAGSGLVYSTYLGGGGDDVGKGIAVDSAGSAYVTGSTHSNSFPTTPGAFDRNLNNISDAFVTKLNAAGSELVYSTYLGGDDLDAGEAITVDSAGNAYTTGNTSSKDFPTANPLQQSNNGSGDVFVTKMDASGSALIYSTYLGGGFHDQGTGIALDASRNAYVVGTTFSTDFPVTPGVFQTALGGSADGFVAKLGRSGAKLIYCTYLGGTNFEGLRSIAVDTSGYAYVTGSTGSFDFPVANPLQSKNSSGPIFKSTDGGRTWIVLNNGLQGFNVEELAIDPQTPSTLYASNFGSFFKTIDGGASWDAGGLTANLRRLAIDPVTPSTLYGGDGLRVFKSTDGGGTFSFADIAEPVSFGPEIAALVIDPKSPSTLYAGMCFCTVAASAKALADGISSSIFKSTDGGSSWSPLTLGACFNTVSIADIEIDPVSPSILYVGSMGCGILKSTDGGITWRSANNGFPFLPQISHLAIDPKNPLIVYAATSLGVYKSTDGGDNWRPTGLIGDSIFLNALAIDPQNPLTLYVGRSRDVFDVFKSTDGGDSWKATGLEGLPVFALAIDPKSPSTLYFSTEFRDDSFVTKLNPSASAPVYSTYLGGYDSDFGNGIAVDSLGSAYVVGGTFSPDFPIAQSTLQPDKSSFGDGFVMKIRDPRNSRITGALIKGKKLFVMGEGFDNGAVILLNGAQQKTRNVESSPMMLLVSKKAGKKITPGQMVALQVRNIDGTLSQEFHFKAPDE